MSKVICNVSCWRCLPGRCSSARQTVVVGSDQLETLIENNELSTMQEIADILEISKSIKLLVKMKNMFFILWKKLNGLFGQPNK